MYEKEKRTSQQAFRKPVGLDSKKTSRRKYLENKKKKNFSKPACNGESCFKSWLPSFLPGCVYLPCLLAINSVVSKNCGG